MGKGMLELAKISIIYINILISIYIYKLLNYDSVWYSMTYCKLRIRNWHDMNTTTASLWESEQGVIFSFSGWKSHLVSYRVDDVLQCLKSIIHRKDMVFTACNCSQLGWTKEIKVLSI